MTTTTNTIPDVPIPAGVANTDEWQDIPPQPYLLLFGELLNTGGVKFTTRSGHGGAVRRWGIGDGSVHDGRHVYLDDDALTSAQARELAAALIETADEVDRWSER